MEQKRSSISTFLEKLDRKLLVNNPTIWSTRIYSTGLYVIAIALGIFLIGMIMPADARRERDISTLVTLLGIFSLLGFIFWMSGLLKFNVFKRFGYWTRLDTLKTFLIYLFIVAVIISWPFLPSFVQGIKANIAYPEKTLMSDINNINLKICQLNKNVLSTNFEKDTLIVSESVEGIEQYYRNGDYSPRTYRVSKEVLEERLLKADSTQKLNDSTYIEYICPNFQFAGTYVRGIYTSMDLYRMVWQQNLPFDSVTVKKELERIVDKYSTDNESNLRTMRFNDPEKAIEWKYGVSEVNKSLSNIRERQSVILGEGLTDQFRGIYYVALAISLLVLVYRHTTRRTFFLTLLTILILTILTGLAIATSGTGDSFTGFIVFYFVICFAVALSIGKSATRAAITGIPLNLAVLLTPYIPICIVSAYYSNITRGRYYGGFYRASTAYQNESFHKLLAELGGFALLIILLATVYQRAYRRWYAAPEQ